MTILAQLQALTEDAKGWRSGTIPTANDHFGAYVAVHGGSGDSIVLDGTFTVDELRELVQWLAEPKARNPDDDRIIDSDDIQDVYGP